ncbi:MAG TPA: class I SAM-dependent methyltransferase [Burkholderiaceae bacterium]|nr:class I SAM-dependent methyltransferase [Burkholderiaceae bacterium]
MQRWLHLLPAGGRVVDLACGAGRHSLLALAAGHRVLAADRDAAALALLRQAAETAGTAPALSVLQADLEGAVWPLQPGCADGLIVTHYLWRERFADWLELLVPGGVFIMETFARGNAAYGKPGNPAFLLEPGELLARLPANWTVVAFEQGLETEPQPRVVQRIVAVRASGPGSTDPVGELPAAAATTGTSAQAAWTLRLNS